MLLLVQVKYGTINRKTSYFQDFGGDFFSKFIYCLLLLLYIYRHVILQETKLFCTKDILYLSFYLGMSLKLVVYH